MNYKTKLFTKTIGLGISLIIGFSGAIAFASPPSEMHITSDGIFSATNVVVFQKSGTTILFSRVTWADTFVRVTVLVNGATIISKDHGEKATMEDINEGDILRIEGPISSSGSGLIVSAKKIIDTSLQVESKIVSGMVKSIDYGKLLFVLPNKIFGQGTTIIIATSTSIQKGVRSINLSEIVPGDKILSVSGAYDYPTDRLVASNVRVNQDQSIFTPHNFQGTLKSISGTTLPISCVVTVNGVDHTVYVPSGSEILNNQKSQTRLSRFIVGDTVRFYGAIRQTNLTEVDASVLRDINF